MKSINKEYQITSIRINLLNTESFNDPALKALLKEGWEVFSYIPVEDAGVPQLILFLKPKNIDLESIDYSYYLKIIILLILFDSLVVFSYLIWFLLN